MASPQADGAPRWSASPWRLLTSPEIVRSPDTQGAVIFADMACDPRLVAFGTIREELWRIHRSPRSAANGIARFRYVEMLEEADAERLAQIIREELAKITGHPIAWRDFPAPFSGERSEGPVAPAQDAPPAVDG